MLPAQPYENDIKHTCTHISCAMNSACLSWRIGQSTHGACLGLQVAQTYSEHAARKGGDLGWKQRNEVGRGRHVSMIVVLTHLDGDALSLVHTCLRCAFAWLWAKCHILVAPARSEHAYCCGSLHLLNLFLAAMSLGFCLCGHLDCLYTCVLAVQLVGPFAEAAFKLQVSMLKQTWIHVSEVMLSEVINERASHKQGYRLAAAADLVHAVSSTGTGLYIRDAHRS